MLCKRGRRRRATSITTTICLDWANTYGIHVRKYFSTMNGCQISNHYQMLGIDRHASQEEIKNAFYMLSKKYHPDVLGPDSDGSSQKFLQIREAYETLRDEQKRRQYDEQLGQWTASSSRRTYSEQYNWKKDFDWEENYWKTQNREYGQQWRQQQKWRPTGERPPFSGASFHRSSTRFSEIPKWADLYYIWRAMMQEQNSHRFQQKSEASNDRNTANQNNNNNYRAKEKMDANREAEQKKWWAEYRRREQKQMISDEVTRFVQRHQFALHSILIAFVIFAMYKNEK